MKGIENNRGIVVIGLLHNPPGISQIVYTFEKADVLEGWLHSFYTTNFQEIAVTCWQMTLLLHFQRRGGDDVRGT